MTPQPHPLQVTQLIADRDARASRLYKSRDSWRLKALKKLARTASRRGGGDGWMRVDQAITSLKLMQENAAGCRCYCTYVVMLLLLVLLLLLLMLWS